MGLWFAGGYTCSHRGSCSHVQMAVGLKSELINLVGKGSQRLGRNWGEVVEQRQIWLKFVICMYEILKKIKYNKTLSSGNSSDCEYHADYLGCSIPYTYQIIIETGWKWV